jgi:hypothetical protein
MRKLALDDITDMRAYERERGEFRARIIEMKRRRRVDLGELLTITFENTDTMRFQIQEMARVERLVSDEQIEHELETYNQLIPDPGELSGTLFIEIDDKPKLHEWLPKLVAIQRAVSFRFDAAPDVACIPDEERLTREEVTSTVHYLKFRFMPEQVQALELGPARLVVEHPNYMATTELTNEQRVELAGDLTG